VHRDIDDVQATPVVSDEIDRLTAIRSNSLANQSR
jgi:hypothetical protein